MPSFTTKMLLDLLERIGSGEVVVTNFDVSNETTEIKVDGKTVSAACKLTGEQTFYITVKQGVPQTFNEAARSFARYVRAYEFSTHTKDQDNG